MKESKLFEWLIVVLVSIACLAAYTVYGAMREAKHPHIVRR
jgi:hypothetical protein